MALRVMQPTAARRQCGSVAIWVVEQPVLGGIGHLTRVRGGWTWYPGQLRLACFVDNEDTWMIYMYHYYLWLALSALFLNSAPPMLFRMFMVTAFDGIGAHHLAIGVVMPLPCSFRQNPPK